MKVLCEMRVRFNGFNNGKISLSMDEAARLLGLSKGTVQRALKQLQEFGFIKLAKVGRWYGRQASSWTITMCPIDEIRHPMSGGNGVLQKRRKNPKNKSSVPKWHSRVL